MAFSNEGFVSELLRRMENASSTGKVTEMPDREQLEMLENMEMPECVYAVGDLVTPRENMNIRGCGQPHKVVSVFDSQFMQNGGTESPLKVCNMVVANVVGDRIKCYLANSTEYERWYNTGI
jgi:hypothetical protein